MSQTNNPPEQGDGGPPVNGRTIHIRLSNTMANEEWELDPPVDVPVHALLARIIREVGARRADEQGGRIPYRLHWPEGERYLIESETLAAAGVRDGDSLVLTYEPRAGAAPAR